METSKVLKERRTIRKFKQERLNREDLIKIIDYARLCAYPTNTQPLKFAVIDDEKTLEKIFPLTKWAGYLENGSPTIEERPVAYIALFGDKAVKTNFEVEAGSAMTTMMYGAWDMGIASCWLGAINREALLELLGISSEKYNLLYLLAVGYPAQESKICEMKDSFRYYIDENNVINVPKKSLKDIIIEL